MQDTSHEGASSTNRLRVRFKKEDKGLATVTEFEQNKSQEYWPSPESSDKYNSPQKSEENCIKSRIETVDEDFPEIVVKDGVEINMKTDALNTRVPLLSEVLSDRSGEDEKSCGHSIRAEKAIRLCAETSTTLRVGLNEKRIGLVATVIEDIRQQKNIELEIILRLICKRTNSTNKLASSQRREPSQLGGNIEQCQSGMSGTSEILQLERTFSGNSEVEQIQVDQFPSIEMDEINREEAEEGKLPVSPDGSSLSIGNIPSNLSTEVRYGPHHVGKTNMNFVGRNKCHGCPGCPLTLTPSDLNDVSSLSIQGCVENVSFASETGGMGCDKKSANHNRGSSCQDSETSAGASAEKESAESVVWSDIYSEGIESLIDKNSQHTGSSTSASWNLEPVSLALAETPENPSPYVESKQVLNYSNDHENKTNNAMDFEVLSSEAVIDGGIQVRRSKMVHNSEPTDGGSQMQAWNTVVETGSPQSPSQLFTEPQRLFVFNAPFHTQNTYLLRATNRGPRKIGWALKTNRPQRFIFSLGSGVLDVGNSVDIHVTCDAIKYNVEKTDRDRISLEWMTLPPDCATSRVSKEMLLQTEVVRRKNLPVFYNP